MCSGAPVGAIADRFYAQALAHPSKIALAGPQGPLTYGELAKAVSNIASGLVALGLTPGNRVIVLSGNSNACVALYLAAADLGLMLAPISPKLPIQAIERAVESVGARAIIAVDDILEKLPVHPSCMKVSLDRQIEAFMTDLDGFVSVSPLGLGEAESPFILTMTSGSTGDPKPIILSQKAKIARANALCDLYGIDNKDNVIASTPLYHSLAMRLVLTPLMQGGRSVLLDGFTPEQWVKSVEEQRVSFAVLVSSQIISIVSHLEDNPDMALDGDLRAIVSSSAALGVEHKRMALSAFGCDIYECYGTSEIAIATSYKLDKGETHIGSVGFAAPNVELRILDAEQRDCPIGEVGEIACRTPMAFDGYFGLADKTEACMHEGYFRTGDLGSLDRHGALFYHGRIKDIIIVGGMNVYPQDVETCVLKTPGVAACAAFGVRHPYLGEQVGIAIVRDQMIAGQGLKARHVRKACVDGLADFQMPVRIVFVEGLPCNEMGKLDRRRLQQDYGDMS